MLEQIFRSAGYKTGLFTSPHLVFLGERIQVNRTPVTPETITSLIGDLDIHGKSIAGEGEENHPTFFEFMAAMAMVHFKNEAVDIAIFETGLGGRLDATNVVDPMISVITSIGLDHTNILGDTIEKIAAEKAGIIKQNRPVVIGRVPDYVADDFIKIAAEKNTSVISVQQQFGDELADYPLTNLFGTFQRWNAATAIAACTHLEKQFPGLIENSNAALQQVDWPGRWQRIILPCGRTVILDATHNPEGAQFLEENLGILELELGQKPWIIAGTLGAFRAQSLIPVVAKHARALYFLEPKQPRAATFEDLQNYIPEGSSFPIENALIEQLFPEMESCSIGQAGDTIVVTGSIYLLGEVLERLTGQQKETGAALQDLI